MATIGKADLLIVPRFDGLSKQVDKALAGVEGKYAASGVRAGNGFGSGLGRSGALVGAFSAVTSRALDSIGEHVGDAVARFDTLNNYPRVMQALGYSAKDAQRSITTMSDRLSVLPTHLDDMATTVKSIAAITGDLDQATDAGLAVNDMLLASGSNAALTTAAMEQFRQVLAKGRPEMQDWKSLTQAMPGQMDQLAKSMLGPTATATDLYVALGGGGGQATLSMDQLLDAVIRLDKKGGEGFASFQQQAKNAVGGISTSAANAANAITKGISGTLDAIGRENISQVLGGMKNGITQVFGAFNASLSDLMPAIKGLVGNVARIAPEVIGGFAAFGLARTATDKVSHLGKVIDGLANNERGLAGASEILGRNLTRDGLVVGALSTAVGIAIGAYADWKSKTDALSKSTTGLASAVGKTSALDGYGGVISDIASGSKAAAMNVDELAKSTARHVDAMNENTARAEEQIATLNGIRNVIDECTGRTDLSADAQGRLRWALEQLNEQYDMNLTANDVMAGSYRDAEGNVHDLKRAVDELVESKKDEARMAALTDNLTEAYKAQADAAQTLAAAQRTYDDKVAFWEGQGLSHDKAVANTESATAIMGPLESARQQMEAADQAVSQLEGDMGELASTTGATADAYDSWSRTLSTAFGAYLEQGGTSLAELTDDMRTLGASTEDLSSLSSEQLDTLRTHYDGTTRSIVGYLDEWGVHMDAASADTARASQGIYDALSYVEQSTGNALSNAGIDVSEFSWQLANAGVSTESLNAIGSENIAALAQAVGGNVDAMVWALKNYNGVPLIDKDGRVNMDQAELIDAQGRVYRWNQDGKPIDQYGNVAVNQQQLMDAQGNVWTWNGSQLIQLNSGVYIEDGQLRDANGEIRTWKATGSDLGTKQGQVNIFTNIIDGAKRLFSHNARGGIRPHADGGIAVREHAVGAIATRAVPLDIVGEDGAEAIVPLTNRRYSQPFADIVAEGVERRTSGRSDAVEAARLILAELPSIIADYTPTMGSRDFSRAVRGAVR